MLCLLSLENVEVNFRIVCIVCLTGVLSCSSPSLEVGSTEAELSSSLVAYALADGLVAAEGHLGFTSVSGGAGDDGQLSVGVPIVVPPGVAGMQPSLSLAYNSAAGDGPLGVGWSLQGLSAITRCGRDVGRDQARDDRLFRENSGELPRLCLDGERLVENDCNGACDPSKPFEAHHYRGESTADWVVDREFTSGGEPGPSDMNKLETNFVVRHRDGTEAIYGGTGAVIRSRLFGAVVGLAAEHPNEHHGKEADWGDPGALTYAWLLREVRDASGNRMEIEYSAVRNDHAVEVLPSVIRYTGTATTTGTRRVEFSYTDRIDPAVHFTGGFALGGFRRLEKVTTFAPVVGAVRAYELEYAASGSTGRLLLDEVVECSLPGGADERCREPVVFEYEAAPAFEISATGFVPANVGGYDAEFGNAGHRLDPHSWAVLDHDGDGAQELLVDEVIWRLDSVNNVIDGAGVGGLTPRIPFVRFDYNSDGVDEVFASNGWIYGILQPTPGVYSMQGESSLSQELDSDRAHYVGNFDGTTPGLDGAVDDVGLSVVDLDGEGVHRRIDLETLILPGAPTPLDANIATFTTADVSDFAMIRFLDDLNADGLMDVIGFQHPTRPQIWINTGTPLPDEGTAYLYAQEMLVDPAACVGSSWACDRFQAYHDAWDDLATYDEQRLRHFRADYRLGDVNGDGRTDVFVLVPIGWESPQPYDCEDEGRRTIPFVYINEGDGFTPYYAGAPFGITDSWYSWISYNVADDACSLDRNLFTHALIDVEGDGTLELAIQTHADAIGESGIAHIQGAASDRMRSYSGGGTYKYGPLGAHIPADLCDDEQCTRYGTVVTSHTNEEKNRTYTHQYAGLRFDPARQEPLGFEAHRVTVESTGDFIERHFRNNQPDPSGRRSTAGMPAFSFSVLGDNSDGFGVEFQRTTYDYVKFGLGTPQETSVPVPLTTEAAGYEATSFGCSFPCDETYVSSLTTGRVMLHQAVSTFTPDENATIVETTVEELDRPLRATAIVNMEHREDPFIIGLPTLIKEVSGSEEVYTHSDFDAQGRLRETWESSGGDVLPTTLVTPGSRGLPELIEYDDGDPLTPNPTTTIGYDDGYLRSVMNALDHESEVVVHPATGDIVYVNDQRGGVSRRRVDGFGRTVLEESPTGRVDTEYVDDGGYTVVTKGAGPEQRVTVDDQGRPAHATVERIGYLAERWYHYRADGRLDRVVETDPGGDISAPQPVTRMHYDARNRLERVTRNVGGGPIRELRNVTYDGLKVTWKENDDGGATAGATRTVTRDRAGRVTRSETSSNEGTQWLRYIYDDFGQIEWVTDQDGESWFHEYDDVGRLTRSIDPDAGDLRFTYDGFSRLDEQQFKSGEVMRKFTYDVLGRVVLLEERDHSGQSTHDTIFAWDPDKNPGSLDFSYREVDDVRRDFGYDNEGRVNNETLTLNGDSHTFQYSFDSVGRLETVTFPDTYKNGTGYRVGYEYNSVGLLDEVRSLHDNALLWRGDRYGTNGSVLDETFGNATSTVRELNPLSTRVSRVTTDSAAGDLLDVELLWNQDGRLSARRDHAQSPIVEETFHYDDLGRLTNWDFAGHTDTGEYNYDGLGNIQTIGHAVVDSAGNQGGSWGHSLTYNGRHVATVDGGTATHDALGRWTQLAGTPDQRDFTAEYNRFDLPTQVVRDGATHTYRYDSGGARVHRISSGPGGLTSQTDFETAGGRFTKEVNASGKSSWRVTVLGGNGPVVEVHMEAYDENPQDKRFLHNDHLASRTLETDATGAVLAEHRTTPFGERLDAAGAPLGFGNALISGFGGHDHEASGFIDMGGRHYDPSIGRFLTVDPLNVQPLNPQSANGYAYVMNDPVTLVDPTGFGTCDPDHGCTSGSDWAGGSGWSGGFGGGGGGGAGGGGVGNNPASQFTTPWLNGWGPKQGGNHSAEERHRVVDVQQARAPRADRRARGMSLSMMAAPLLNMFLQIPFDVPSPREAAGTLVDDGGMYLIHLRLDLPGPSRHPRSPAEHDLGPTNTRPDDFGHAWVVFERPNGTSVHRGWYPAEEPTFWSDTGALRRGETRNDSGRHYDYEVIFPVTQRRFEHALADSRNTDARSWGAAYSCVAYALDCFDEAGVNGLDDGLSFLALPGGFQYLQSQWPGVLAVQLFKRGIGYYVHNKRPIGREYENAF